jgi:DNA integrity scanning protein DisA with diadenylate cyclase activity
MISNVNFSNLDRKLRTELVSMDGACILDLAGNICAAGAIIKNDSGSSEGGRGAAAKKLSEFGIAIKISTDGYIEIYRDREIVFSIK